MKYVNADQQLNKINKNTGKKYQTITFNCEKEKFNTWVGLKLMIKYKGEDIEFVDEDHIKIIEAHLNETQNSTADSCFLWEKDLMSILVKMKDTEKVQLLNGEFYNKKELLSKMYSDGFYYGDLGKLALSSSAIKSLLDSPKAYKRSLNFKSDSGVFKTGRLIHLAALEPDKIDSLCHIVNCKTYACKEYKEKVKEVGSPNFVFTIKEYDKAMYLVDDLLQNDVWQDFTRNAKFEIPGFDIVNGHPFRAKADILGDEVMGDLKTTSDLKAFKYAAKKYSYDVQVYLYCNIFKRHYKDFMFFALDKSTGDIGIYEVSESFYDSGKDKVLYAIDIYEKYFRDGVEDLNNYIIKDTLE